MPLKIWRGDAPAVAQVTTVVPANIEVGDIFILTINGKSVQFAATAATAANVCDGLAAAIADTDIPEFGDVEASVANGVLTLTAAEPGKPFTISGSTSNSGASSVVVETLVEGVAAASEVQKFSIPSSATGGTWKITFGEATTASLNVGDSAGTVQTALQGLSTVGSGNATVSKSGDEYTVTFAGTLANQNVASLVVALYLDKPLIEVVQQGAAFGPAKNEIQKLRLPNSDVTSKTFTLTFNGDTTASQSPPVTASALQSWLRLQWQDVNTVVVTDSGDGGFLIEFTASAGNANQPTITSASTWTAAEGRYDIAVTTTTPGGTATNEQQKITLSPTPTGGTFTLSFGGNTTGTIAYNAAAATVQTALQGLASIGSGNCSVSGSAGGPWTVTFTGTKAATNVAQMTGSGAGLTGAATQTLTVTTTVNSSGPNHWDTPANWSPSGVPVAGDDVRFEFGDSQCLYGLSQSGITLASLRVFQAYTGQIGLPRQNDDGYQEYRTRELTCGITSVLIGVGEGGGAGKIALNTGSVQTTIEIRNTGGSNDAGIPAVTWYGTHASNSVTVLDGDFGTALYSDQSATISSLIQRGGNVSLSNSALSNLIAPNQRITAHNCTLGGQPLEL